MNIDLPPMRHRMIRSGPHKLIWFADDEPLLFDMEESSDVLNNWAEQTENAPVVARLSNALHAGRGPVAINQEMATKAARRQVIRKWETSTNPAELMRWFDPKNTEHI